MTQLVLKIFVLFAMVGVVFPEAAFAQQQPNVPAAVQQTENTVERAVDEGTGFLGPLRR